ncbi:hypothetical protein UFOVP263_49 [uncultured Caudovirales phage]|uniref:Uncharacterized protein n=1 Tax=uncultured Caudovirales phage TaxID=2100421 RepID=A0A6J5TCE9_9CAUD|nr:hypothetical protein UFOVP263_49 [uncultured Caudovirales phage]CAB4242007.1 hypothetical protein UFOVP91_13 [uncultured Caudovirales phage]
MVFNGHTQEYVESLDEEIFTEIQVMYADGMLGNRGIYDAIAPLTSAVFNYIRASGTPAYKSNEMFPWINEYLIHPDVDENKANESLLLFLSQAPSFDMERFKNGSHASI